MIEILITLVIIAIAMLGTAGLQLNAMRLNKGSQFRTQAILLAADISERMESNRIAAVDGNYVLPTTDTPSTAGTQCNAAVCAGPALATWDLSQWGQAIDNLLPQATWSVSRTVAGSSLASPPTPSTYTITISWIDRGDGKTETNGVIVDSFTATRQIGI